jgi:hypothetical protein
MELYRHFDLRELKKWSYSFPCFYTRPLSSIWINKDLRLNVKLKQLSTFSYADYRGKRNMCLFYDWFIHGILDRQHDNFLSVKAINSVVPIVPSQG